MERKPPVSAGQKVIGWLRVLLEHRHLPVALATGAILLMVPAVKTGLMADDLVQRPIQFKADGVASSMAELLPHDTGTLYRVLAGLFGSINTPAQLAAAKNYGLLGWWAPDDIRFALWRPLTAFTHWVDYRLFPNTPGLMHLHNIAWFAAVVFLAATAYRKLLVPAWAAGLAGVLFLLDNDTYFPVLFVANRGFIVALALGLVALLEHHRWRTTQSRVALGLSLCAFAASLLANEGGASSLAFMLAYALVLEPGSWRKRAWTVLPCLLVLLAWRVVYQGFGYGVAHGGGGVNNVGGYIDPSQEPLRFAGQLVPRALALAGGQISGIPPDALLLLKAAWQSGLVAFYAGFLAAVFLVLVPLLRQNAQTRFWFAVMVLALIPAATVTPLSKNLAFVAVGAFGLLASFLGALVAGAGRLTESCWLRALSWTVGSLLVLAHIPGAVAGRIISVQFTPWVLGGINRLVDLPETPQIGEQDVILINPPLQISTVYAPCVRLYQGKAVPRSIRALIPGYASIQLQRTGEKTLVVQTSVRDMFTCEELGPSHMSYGCNSVDGVVVGRRRWTPGDRQVLRGLTVEILKTSSDGLPARVAFQFEEPLESPLYHWLRFDWRHFSYQVFKLPRIGETVQVQGPVR